MEEEMFKFRLMSLITGTICFQTARLINSSGTGKTAAQGTLTERHIADFTRFTCKLVPQYFMIKPIYNIS